MPEILKPIIHSESVVILMQNGLGLEADLSLQLPGMAIGGGLAFICSNKIGPGRIQHLDYGRIIIGSYNVPDSEILKSLVLDFQAAGVPSELSPDLNQSRWQKLAWNIPFSGLTVVLDTNTEMLMLNENSRQLAEELMLEVIRGANACGVPLQESLARQMIDMTMKMNPYAPSMKLDYDHRRPMEIEYIYSKPVQAAKDAGFEMHQISMLEKQLRFIESNRFNP